MVYFIDTNIGIGYSIFPDKFHNPCREFISSTLDDIYWSEGVYKEFNDKFNEILNNIEDFLDIINHVLNNHPNSFYNKDSFASFILKKTNNISLDNEKKYRLIDIFWENCLSGFPHEINQICEKFDDFTLYVPNLFSEQKQSLIDKLICYNCGLDNYNNYPNLKSSLSNNGVHYPDYKFVLDAHDLGKNKIVTFITSDEKMVNAIILNNLLDSLFIEEYVVLH